MTDNERQHTPAGIQPSPYLQVQFERRGAVPKVLLPDLLPDSKSVWRTLTRIDRIVDVVSRGRESLDLSVCPVRRS